MGSVHDSKAEVRIRLVSFWLMLRVAESWFVSLKMGILVPDRNHEISQTECVQSRCTFTTDSQTDRQTETAGYRHATASLVSGQSVSQSVIQ